MSEAAAARRAVVILIVEDEPIQRLDLIDLVQGAGFETVDAWDADHAVSILEERTDITIVVTDIDMPGSMDGMKFAAAIRDRWPPIEIIVTTAGKKPSADTMPARSILIPKPINGQELVDALRRFSA